MATPWRVPPLWSGRTVAVLASGQSMSQAVADAVHAAGIPAIVINETFRLAPWADMLYGADGAWWKVRQDEALHFRGLKVTAHEACIYPQVMLLNDTGTAGFDPDPGSIRTGGNGGYAGIHIAAQGRAARILACGFDMRPGHWHGDHPEPLRNAEEVTYRKWIGRFGLLARELAQRHVDVLNCTPGSALPCFPIVGLEDAIASRAVLAA